MSQSLATVAGSALSVMTLATSVVRVGVSSLADTAFSADEIVGVTFDLVISGRTFCAANSFFGSSSATKLSAVIDGSVVKMSPASIWPFFSALIVSGPPASSGLNVPNVTP